MKIMESDDYREYGENAGEILREHSQVLDVDQKSDLEIVKRRAETLQKIEAATGLDFAVANDTDPHVAAFVTTADSKAHMVEHTLDNYDWALYAARHEKEHVNNKIYSIDLRKNLELQHFDILREFMQDEGVEIEDVDLMEGFNDLITATKYGANDKSGYSDEEVPAAKKLDEICLKLTGFSLMWTFDSGNKNLFYRRLALLCTLLETNKQAKKVLTMVA